MKTSAVTIKELSNLSGFSISTVSKALNDKLEISKATRDTIKTIAKQHNYVPNNYAVSLRVKKTESIAVILPEVTEQCYSHALCYLQETAESKGYRILFYQSFYSYTKEREYIKSLSDGSVDGIIVVSNKHKSKINYHHNSTPVELLKVKNNQCLVELKSLSNNSLARLLNY